MCGLAYVDWRHAEHAKASSPQPSPPAEEREKPRAQVHGRNACAKAEGGYKQDNPTGL
jgi:hypothetical protein